MAERSRGGAKRAPHRVHVVPVLQRPAGRLFRDWLAITLGRHIWAWRPLSESELAHELAHVRQWARHGWSYPVAYALASARAVLSGGHWYRDNAFEREARAAADSVGRESARPS